MSQVLPRREDLYASEEYGSRLLCETISEFSSGTWRLHSCAVVNARKQRGKRIVVYAFSYTSSDDPQRVRHGRALAKLYGQDRGGISHDAQTVLWGAGFQSGPFRVPKPYGYAPHLGVLLQEQVNAAAWADRLGGAADELRQASTLAACWLVHLQCSTVEAADLGREAEIGTVQAFGDACARSYPAYKPAIVGLARELDRRLRADRSPLVPSHGDFHPKNVLLDDQGVATVIDFDHFGSRSAAFDIGYAIGQLHIMSYLRLGDLTAGACASAAFWRCCQLAGRTGWSDVATHVARTFVQSLHYELCVLRNGRTGLIPLWLRLAETFLAHDELPQLHGLAPH